MSALTRRNLALFFAVGITSTLVAVLIAYYVPVGVLLVAAFRVSIREGQALLGRALTIDAASRKHSCLARMYGLARNSAGSY